MSHHSLRDIVNEENDWDIDEQLADIQRIVHEPYVAKCRGEYLHNDLGVNADLCTEGLTKALAEALELPETISLGDVLCLVC